MFIVLFALIQVLTSAPNVLIINIQQIGWGDVDVYTPWRSETPGIARIARQGSVLDQVYCETSSAASQAGLLSGKLPASWGFYSSNTAETSTVHEDSLFALPRDTEYLPGLLEQHSTMFIGRWLLGQNKAASPLNYGFDKFYGVVSNRDGKYTSLPNPGLYKDNTLIGRLFESSGLELDHGLCTLSQKYRAEAVSFIQQSTQPFYLHISLDALVHSPYRSAAWINSSISSRHTHFAEGLKEIDNAVSVMYDTLVTKGIANNTVILITGDSTALASRFSGGNNAPFSGQFQDTTEGGVRVPAILYYPERLSRTGRSEQVMNMQDLHSTLLSLCGLSTRPCNKGCVAGGIDMTEMLKTGDTRERVIPIFRGRTLMALRLGRYKAHRYAEQSFIPGQFLDELTQYKLADFTKAPLLYDVITDPTERFCIGGEFPVGSERYTGVIADILKWANTILNQVKEDGGLLNECDVSSREWSPEGCGALRDMCHTQPEAKLALCSLPFD